MNLQLLGAGNCDLSMQGYEDVIECPYNRAHQIMSFRMQTHLYKCRKNYKDLKYVKCPFNETHDLPEQELKYHTTICPDRETFDRYKYCIRTTAATFVAEPDQPVEETRAICEMDDEETWDQNCKVKAYNPRAYAARSHVIRKCTGMAPSEKKAFKEAERKRLADLGNRPK
uniref:CHHC U11-48K-type domain-containing protein n=1 Tax=Culex tarsalis TaxID=7177 RepID=A0A1Q3EWW8_CULTA